MLSRNPGNGSTPSSPRDSKGRRLGDDAWLEGLEGRRFDREDEIDNL